MSSTSFLRNPGRHFPVLIALVTFVLLGVAMSYLPDALVQAATPPAQSRIAVPERLVGDEWSGGPRECDLQNGISRACLFFD
jgi:hypothetical protein